MVVLRIEQFGAKKIIQAVVLTRLSACWVGGHCLPLFRPSPFFTGGGWLRDTGKYKRHYLPVWTDSNVLMFVHVFYFFRRNGQFVELLLYSLKLVKFSFWNSNGTHTLFHRYYSAIDPHFYVNILRFSNLRAFHFLHVRVCASTIVVLTARGGYSTRNKRW